MDVMAVVGFGYVDLPVAAAFGEVVPSIGYDLSRVKLGSYRRRPDLGGTVSADELQSATLLRFTSQASDLTETDYIVIAVPTPVEGARHPGFGLLVSASKSVGTHMESGCTVIYESTVYSSATEEICIPQLEKVSGKRWQRDFHVGYSPKRINPGDRQHTPANTIKVVAGDSPATLELVSALYAHVVPAGLQRVSSLKVAETAKVIENTKRDLNIALMNELAVIFNMLGLDTPEALQAAGATWNFLPFRPWLGERALRRRRLLLRASQCRNAGPPPAGLCGGTTYQRRHGQIHCIANRQTIDPGWQSN